MSTSASNPATWQDALAKYSGAFITACLAVAGTTWTVAELIRVNPLEKRVTEAEKNVEELHKRESELKQNIKDQNAAIEPYQKELNKMLANNKQLEAELASAKGDIEQWRSALNSWKEANEGLKTNLSLYAANCGILGQIRGIESKKESNERDIRYAIVNPSTAEYRRLDEYKRNAQEYQQRIIQLQEKLTCGKP